MQCKINLEESFLYHLEILFNRKLPFNRQLDLLRSKNLNDSASHLKTRREEIAGCYCSCMNILFFYGHTHTEY